MDTFAMSALESDDDWAARLTAKQRQCRGWGRHWLPERHVRDAERLSNGGLRWYLRCEKCKLPVIYTYYERDNTYTIQYDYGDPKTANYSRKGRGRLSPTQRIQLRRMAMGL